MVDLVVVGACVVVEAVVETVVVVVVDGIVDDIVVYLNILEGFWMLTIFSTEASSSTFL